MSQPAGATAPVVSLRGLRKEFPGVGGGARVVAVDGVDLDIAEGEFVTLLGPSGSGKTTVLRMIAGFETPSGGQVLLRGADVTRTAPFERDVNTVFQDYALFPHMTVLQNVEYGLRVKKVPRAQRRERALEALAGVRLEGMDKRAPGQLSGGQRQRVALARALVNRPSVLLLDEPLGALDLKLREQMQVELKQIQREVGITFVFVTHDQEEALTMSDRIVVFNRGRVDQVGTPAEIYEHPRTTFVAGFVGTSNLLHAKASEALLGEAGLFSVRPEKIRLLADGEDPVAGETVAPAVVEEVVYAGATTRIVARLDAGDSLVVQRQNQRTSSLDTEGLRGARVRLAWSREHASRLPDDESASATPL